tara:strand:+ start:457 stop:795 length:339 start_codon:yes stop_codon:yes gene_type:complete
MTIKNSSSDEVVLEELGTRVARARLNKNVTQNVLAKEAGVSLPTLQRIEQGHSTNLTNFIRVLRALKLLDNMESLMPTAMKSPLHEALTGQKLRQRAHPKDDNEQQVWEWGE